jgi:uncharacterized protein YjbI with pentapeptide repeats
MGMKYGNRGYEPMEVLFLRLLLAALCPGMLVPTFTLAQGREMGEGAKKPISREELDILVQGGKKQGKEEIEIANAIIQGNDLIEVIQTMDVAITVRHAVIEGGLDFKRLPSTPLDQVTLPPSWSDEEKKQWMARKRSLGITALHVVTRDIAIVDSDIRPMQGKCPNAPVLAVSATATFFSGAANFEGATFGGAANFAGVSFDALAYFKEAQFFRRLTVIGAQFKTYADFRDTLIRQLSFQNATRPVIIEGRMDFRRATISEAHIQDITFVKDVNFSDVIFGTAVSEKEHTVKTEGKKAGNCATLASDFATVFRFVTFEGNAYFLRTCFAGRTSLEWVFFHKDANFTSATLKGRVENGRSMFSFFKGSAEHDKPVFSLSYVNFANLRITWPQLSDPVSWVSKDEEHIQSFIDLNDTKESEMSRKQGLESPSEDLQQELEPLSEVLKSFEAHFRGQNQLDDANAVYYAMKIAELQEASEHREDWRSVGRWLGLETIWFFGGRSAGMAQGSG